MVLINVLDHVDKCYSNDDGRIIFSEIKSAFSANQKVTVSFQGVTSLNSSFVNSAFIELLNDHNMAFIKSHLSFINSTQQINSIIKNRFAFEIDKKKNLMAV